MSINTDLSDSTKLRQVLTLVVLIVAVYGVSSCIAPFASQLHLSIPDKVWIYRRFDNFPAIAAFLTGMLAVSPQKEFRLTPFLALPLIWILATNARGPWLVPGTFDKYNDSITPVVVVCLIAMVAGLLFQILLRRINIFDRVAKSSWTGYLLAAISLVAIVIAETLTPMESRVPLSLHIWVGAIVAVAAIIALLSPKLLGES